MQKKKIDVQTIERPPHGKGYLLHTGSEILCPHSGHIIANTQNTRVFVAGKPVITQVDSYTVSECQSKPEGVSKPCVTIGWTSVSNRVFVNGNPVILDRSIGLCQSADQSPQGTSVVASTQKRVKGS